MWIARYRYIDLRAIVSAMLMLSVLFCSISVNAAPVADKPKLMILIEEKVMGVFGTTGHEAPGQAEIVLSEKFNALGFSVVDPQTARRNLIQAKGLRLLEGNDRAAAAAGLQHEAQYSIIGTAISKQAGAKLYGSQMQSIQATLTARIVSNDNARVIATATRTATQVHIDEVQGGVLAIESAATEIADELGNQMMAYPQEAKGGAQEITLNISGLVSYRHLDFVMNYFEKEIKGVRAVYLRNFSEGLADLAVDYQGSMEGLARFVARKRFKGFRLEPTNVTANRMDLAVVLDKR